MASDGLRGIVPKEQQMICRLWRGWTTPEHADAYQRTVHTEVIPSIEQRNMPGFLHIDLMKRELGSEIEFQTLMWFESVDAIKLFAGEDCAISHVPPRARTLLKHFDSRASHYEVIDGRPQ